MRLCLLLFYPFRTRRLAESGNIFKYITFRAFYKGNFLKRRKPGKQAVELALRFIRTFPCGKADFCWLSYEPENAAAKSLYASFGFTETGEKDGEEQIAVLKL